MNIAFFGTPAICIPTLEALFRSSHKVVCIVTQPDKPAGRGKAVSFSPAKRFGIENNIPVFQPKKISAEIDTLFANITHPDVIITCAFGQILRQNVLDYCKFGVINVHFSLLPKYRGATPVTFAILNGDKKTGVTIMQTDIGIDTGDVFTQTEVDIMDTETTLDLSIRLSHIAAELLLSTLAKVENGTAKRVKQDNAAASYYPMLSRTDGKITFENSKNPNSPATATQTFRGELITMTPAQTVDFVRAMNPWPFAYTSSNFGDLKIHKCHVGETGELKIEIVQPAGGRAMRFGDFLNGHKGFKFE
jgi:methionyl-tRNA formyltransferase